jgi:hypothetical protein
MSSSLRRSATDVALPFKKKYAAERKAVTRNWILKFCERNSRYAELDFTHANAFAISKQWKLKNRSFWWSKNTQNGHRVLERIRGAVESQLTALVENGNEPAWLRACMNYAVNSYCERDDLKKRREIDSIKREQIDKLMLPDALGQEIWEFVGGTTKRTSQIVQRKVVDEMAAQNLADATVADFLDFARSWERPPAAKKRKRESPENPVRRRIWIGDRASSLIKAPSVRIIVDDDIGVFMNARRKPTFGDLNGIVQNHEVLRAIFPEGFRLEDFHGNDVSEDIEKISNVVVSEKFTVRAVSSAKERREPVYKCKVISSFRFDNHYKEFIVKDDTMTKTQMVESVKKEIRRHRNSISCVSGNVEGSGPYYYKTENFEQGFEEWITSSGVSYKCATAAENDINFTLRVSRSAKCDMCCEECRVSLVNGGSAAVENIKRGHLNFHKAYGGTFFCNL